VKTLRQKAHIAFRKRYRFGGSNITNVTLQ
jgi:hypothetical protein